MSISKKGLSNPLLELYYMYPGKIKWWDWEEISKNKCITVSDIEENIDLPWRWYAISENPNLTWEFVKKYRHKKWDWKKLSMHSCITWDIIQNNINFEYYGISIYMGSNPYKWYMSYVSLNPNITYDIFISDPSIPGWNIKNIIKNPGITWEGIKRSLLSIETTNTNIRIFKTYFAFNIDTACVLSNPNMTIDIIFNEFGNYINFILAQLSCVEILIKKDDFSEKYYDIFKCKGLINIDSMCNVLEHKNIRIEFILLRKMINPEIYNHRVSFSRNLNLTQDHILRLSDEYFDWKTLTRHPNVTMRFIKNHPEKSWDCYNISSNPNLMIYTVNKSDNLRNRVINFKNMSCNTFSRHRQLYKVTNFFILNKSKYVIPGDVSIYLCKKFICKRC